MLKRLLSRAAGLSLHWLAGVPIHDATNNFKLYRRDFLDSVTIESTGGFELAIELTAKADPCGRPMAEVPTTWRDRTAGESRFKICGPGCRSTCAGTSTPSAADSPGRRRAR